MAARSTPRIASPRELAALQLSIIHALSDHDDPALFELIERARDVWGGLTRLDGQAAKVEPKGPTGQSPACTIDLSGISAKLRSVREGLTPFAACSQATKGVLREVIDEIGLAAAFGPLFVPSNAKP